jgi:cobalamin biosynthesis Mg chelatase CobN
MKRILAILLTLSILSGCRSHREIEQRETQHAVAVQSVAATTIASAVEDWNETIVRELVVMQADSTGTLKETARMTSTEHRTGRHGQKIENNDKKVDSAAFSSEMQVNYKEQNETTAERQKTRFWRNAFFYVVMFAAIVILVVLLWHKSNLKSWIKRLTLRN